MKRFLTLLAGLVVCVCASAQDDELLLRNWIQTLASDEFGGRKPMTEYETRTVNYLAKELEQMGLKPRAKKFPPYVVAYLAEKFCIDL